MPRRGRGPVDLGRPDVTAVIEERYAAEPAGWRKQRLLAVKLVCKKELTTSEIAARCQITRQQLSTWFNKVREGGLEALLQRWRRGPLARNKNMQGVKDSVFAELRVKLEKRQFTTVEQVQEWLDKRHGIKRPHQTVWEWIKRIRREAAASLPPPPLKGPSREKNLLKRYSRK